jgi:hypothetical protein
MPGPKSKPHSSLVENIFGHAGKAIAHEITAIQRQTKDINCKPLQKILSTAIIGIPCA